MAATTGGTSPEFRQQLQSEVEAWRRDRLITSKAARGILARYGLSLSGWDVSAATRARLAVLFGTLGGLLVGLGTVLFVASNWEGLPHFAKLALLVGAVLLANSIGFVLSRKNHPRIGASVIFAAGLVYAASVFLTGQEYNVSVTDSILLLLCTIGLLPMAYAVTSRPLLIAGLVGLIGWYGMLIDTWGAWRGPHALLPIAFLGWSVVFISVGDAENRPAFRRMGDLTRILGLELLSFVIFLLGFTEFWRSAGEAAGYQPAVNFIYSVAALVVLAVVAAAVACWRRAWARPALAQASGLLLALAVASAIILIHPLGSAEEYALAFNALALLLVLGGLFLGVTGGRESLINASLILFGAVVFARYFDFLGTLFDRSLVFVGAGLLLLVGGFVLESSRRRLLVHARRREVSHAV